MNSDRSAVIRIGEEEYPLLLTTKATRENRHHVGNHCLVPADERMADDPLLVGRPVPVEIFRIFGFFIPVPFSLAPEFVYAAADKFLVFRVAVEVLMCGEERFEDKRCFDQVAAVVGIAEEWHHFAGSSVDKVGEYAVEACISAVIF